LATSGVCDGGRFDALYVFGFGGATDVEKVDKSIVRLNNYTNFENIFQCK
jgi:hypothetical protein